MGRNQEGGRSTKKAADGGAPAKAPSKATPQQAAPATPASKKSPSVRTPKKPANDLSLERVLESRAALEALSGRSLESLVDEYAPKDRSLNNIDAIVAPRTTDPTVNLVKGARVRQCALCNEDIWVAPSSFAAFKGRIMPPLWFAECTMMYAELNSPLRRRPAGRA